MGLQATRDYYDFSEIVADYVSLVGSAKVALAQRSEKLKLLQNAEEVLTKKKEQHARLKAAKEPKPDKIDAADREAQDADLRMKEASIPSCVHLPCLFAMHCVWQQTSRCRGSRPTTPICAAIDTPCGVGLRPD